MRPYLNRDHTEKPRPGTICAAVMVPEEAERWAALQPADESKHHRHYPAAWALGLSDQPDKQFPSGIGLWELPVPNMVFVSAPADTGEVCPACHEGPGADLMPALLLLRGKPSSGPEARRDGFRWPCNHESCGPASCNQDSRPCPECGRRVGHQHGCPLERPFSTEGVVKRDG